MESDIHWVVIFFRLVFALFLGAVIGHERQKKGRSAGLRTHILVCLGSALTMLLSVRLHYVFFEAGGFDSAKIAAGVITGIGFLGAGAIIKGEQGSRGLTTAASVWVSAVLGLAVGAGFYFGALVTAVLMYVTLTYLIKFE